MIECRMSKTLSIGKHSQNLLDTPFPAPPCFSLPAFTVERQPGRRDTFQGGSRVKSSCLEHRQTPLAGREVLDQHHLKERVARRERSGVCAVQHGGHCPRGALEAVASLYFSFTLGHLNI